MFSSEQNFVINGHSDRALEKVLTLALELDGSKIKAFYKDENGLVLCKYQCSNSNTYPFEATIPVIIEQIKQYINELSSEEILRLAGDEPDNDGSVYLGWEIFHPLWYGNNEIKKYELAAVIAVRPSWIVYGK